MTGGTDQDLLEAARGGDADALEELLRRYQPRLYRFSMKMCRRPEDAQDVLQDSLLAVARTVRGFRGASSASTWLYTIARSFCIKQRRRSRFAPAAEVSLEAEGPLEVPDRRPTPDRLVEVREVREALESALRALDPPHREVLVLRDVEGLTAPEVAEVTGLGVEAVKSRLHRARTRLRAHLAPALGLVPGPAAPGCPDVVTLFSRHLEGEIDPGVCARMERHIAECATCRTACDSLKATLSLCSAAPAPEVPERVQASIRTAIRELLARA